MERDRGSPFHPPGQHRNVVTPLLPGSALFARNTLPDRSAVAGSAFQRATRGRAGLLCGRGFLAD